MAWKLSCGPGAKGMVPILEKTTPANEKRLVFTGCAGWSIPAMAAGYFPKTGTRLERYAQIFNTVEINSSFYRSHKLETYQKWAAAVPEYFLFAVKIPKAITHGNKLRNSAEMMDAFLNETCGLGPKLGPLLVQLPPSLAFDVETANSFFSMLRERFNGRVVCEPRNITWFHGEAGALLESLSIGRVGADPSISEAAGAPGGFPQIRYYRLHGSPRIYYSSYGVDFLNRLAAAVQKDTSRQNESWCIFDNTAAGEATKNALLLQELLA